MEKLYKEVEKVNSDSEFIKLMSVEEERKDINTIKELGVEQGIEQGSENKSK